MILNESTSFSSSFLEWPYFQFSWGKSMKACKNSWKWTKDLTMERICWCFLMFWKNITTTHPSNPNLRRKSKTILNSNGNLIETKQLTRMMRFLCYFSCQLKSKTNSSEATYSATSSANSKAFWKYQNLDFFNCRIKGIILLGMIRVIEIL